MVSLLICCLSCHFEPVCCRIQWPSCNSKCIRIWRTFCPPKWGWWNSSCLKGYRVWLQKMVFPMGKTAASEAQILNLIHGNTTTFSRLSFRGVRLKASPDQHWAKENESQVVTIQVFQKLSMYIVYILTYFDNLRRCSETLKRFSQEVFGGPTAYPQPENHNIHLEVLASSSPRTPAGALFSRNAHDISSVVAAFSTIEYAHKSLFKALQRPVFSRCFST